MAENDTAPLTQEERTELEALRAEKARREEEARARAERAELEALRAEQARADAEQVAPAQPAAQPDAAPKAKKRPAAAPEADESAEKTFGVRMVTSDTVDEDGIPTMPMAQKILIAIAAVGVVAFFVMYVL